MKTLNIKREKSFVCSQMYYWVILKYSRDELTERFPQNSHVNQIGIPAAPDGFNPNEYGTPIENGQEIIFEIDDTVNSVFAVTVDGILSNEIKIDPLAAQVQVTILTKGGWKTAGHPYLIMTQDK